MNYLIILIYLLERNDFIWGWTNSSNADLKVGISS